MTGKVAAANVCEQEPGIAQTAMAEIVHAILSPSEFDLFAEFGQERLLPQGDHLFHRGHPGDTMYVIVRGCIELDFGEDLLVKSLGPNEFFGELGLLIGDHPRSADARAVADSVVLELGNADFQLLITELDSFFSYHLH